MSGVRIAWWRKLEPFMLLGVLCAATADRVVGNNDAGWLCVAAFFAGMMHSRYGVR